MLDQMQTNTTTSIEEYYVYIVIKLVPNRINFKFYRTKRIKTFYLSFNNVLLKVKFSFTKYKRVTLRNLITNLQRS